MDSLDQNFAFEIIDQPSDAATGSMDTKNCMREYNTMTSEIEVIDEDVGWTIVGTEENDAHQRDSGSDNLNHNTMTENVEAVEACTLNESPYFHLGTVQIENFDKRSLEATATVSKKPVLNEAQSNPEAFLHNGIHRRSLHLKDNPHAVISVPDQSSLNSEGPKSPFRTPCTPIKGEETEKIQPRYPQSRNNTVNIPKPTGIGLHLNSIINVLQPGSAAVIHAKSTQTFNFSIQGTKSTPTINSHLPDTSKSTSVFTPVDNVSPFTDGNESQTHATVSVDPATSLSSMVIESSKNSVDDQSAQCSRSLYTNIETDGISEELKSNPKKKRKRSSDANDGDGCKRCRCRKSKCLKLYCDCFAAGLYCAGSCACEGCFNRPEYEDKVLESRKLIESRNPHAFAPKIIEHIIEPPASSPGEEETFYTPSSARHKRGCNCKKSMCLKKYCECYHANVGCSDGCRCEGCKNVFGHKGEYSLDKDVLSKEGTTERTDGLILEKSPSVNGGLCDSELTPQTPAVQFKKVAREGNLRPRQCFPFSPMSSDNVAMISDAATEVIDLVSPRKESYHGYEETPGEFSSVMKKTRNHSGSNQYSSPGSFSSLLSPVTPMAKSGASRTLKAVEHDGELSITMQDDTPDILKDSPAPPNAVKSSSPNKKRVSPPHAPRQQIGLRPLTGLRTGRKFILKAVPSIPPQGHNNK